MNVFSSYSLWLIFLPQDKCSKDKVMLACRQVGASDLTVLAWADRETVFGVTDSPECGGWEEYGTTNTCSGNVVQVIVCSPVWLLGRKAVPQEY